MNVHMGYAASSSRRDRCEGFGAGIEIERPERVRDKTVEVEGKR